MLIVQRDSFQIQKSVPTALDDREGNYVGIHSSLCTHLPFTDTFYVKIWFLEECTMNRLEVRGANKKVNYIVTSNTLIICHYMN